MSAQNEVRYAVVGSWPFPLDMLRRDNAVPASVADEALVHALSQESAPERGLEPVTINLVIRDADRFTRPCTERWVSFGWQVPGDEEYRAMQEHRAREGRMAELYASARAKLTDEELEAVFWHACRH